jgi:hypothetical protein
MEEARQKVRSVLNADKDTSKGASKEVLLPVNERVAQEIKDVAGVDVSGYRHTIDVSGVNHAIKNHGNEKSEASRGQIAITEKDFEKIPEALTTPDSISYMGKDAKGNDVIRYEKRLGDALYLFEEIRKGRRELAFETMYKRKIKGSEQLNTPPLLTSKTTPFYQNQPDKQAGLSESKGTKNSEIAKQNSENSSATGENAPVRLHAASRPTLKGNFFEYFKQLSLWTADRIDEKKTKLGAIHRDAILSDYQKILRALGEQRDDFRQSGNAVAAFVRDLISNQTFDEMGRAQLNQIVTQVKNAATRTDVLGSAKRIFDIVLDRQLSVAEKVLDRQLDLKLRGHNSAGVAVGKLVSDNARVAVESFSRYYKLPLEDVEERLAKLEDMSADEEDPLKQEKIASEQLGLSVARKYATLVEGARKGVRSVEEEIAEEQEKIAANQDDKTDKNGKPYKATKPGREREVKISREVVSTLEDELRERKETLRKGLDFISTEINAIIELGKSAKQGEDMARAERKKSLRRSAFFDLSGVQPELYKKNTGKTFFQKAFDALSSPLGSFDFVLRTLGRDAIDGEGNLFNHFSQAVVNAIEAEYSGVEDAAAMLDAKSTELFGKSADKVMKRMSNKQSGVTLSVVNPLNGEEKAVSLTVGNAAYLYMANKMADTKPSLRRMGILEEDVERVKNALPERVVQLADWMQDEFYPKLREKYNRTHLLLYGIQMANIPLYVPKKILKATVRMDEDIAAIGPVALPLTLAGALIERRRNAQPLDVVNTDFLDVAFGHIREMEHWNAFAGVTEDVNTLLSSPRFKVKLENIRTGLTDTFREAAQVAVGAYRQDGEWAFTSVVLRSYGKSKIAFRLNTAAKQILSLPAFATEGTPDILAYMAINIANPYGSWVWAMENLPLFKKRVKSRLAGNEKLDMSEEKMGRILKSLDKASDVGMYPNMFVDAITVAVGARSVYQHKKKVYLKAGYPEHVAERKALLNATTAFNETQQSAEGFFLAPIQRRRDPFSQGFSVYNNTNVGYQRKVVVASMNVLRYAKRRDKMIHVREKQLIADGVSEDRAGRQARRDVDLSFRRSCAQLIMNGYFLQWLWNFGLMGLSATALAALAGGDDGKRNKKLKKLARNATIKSLSAPVRGLVGGATIESIIDGQLRGMNMIKAVAKIHPFAEDSEKEISNVIKAVMKDDYAMLVYHVANFASGIAGMNMDTISNISAALFDLATTNTDLSAQQVILDLSIIANLPNSQTREMAKALKNGSADDFIKEYTKWRNDYGALYRLVKPGAGVKSSPSERRTLRDVTKRQPSK